MDKLNIHHDQAVVIIDDDESIHLIWQTRFNVYQCNLLHFYSIAQFMQWQEGDSIRHGSILYLCDYEFIGSDKNGIDLINQLGISYCSILVTNRFYTDEIVMRCEASNIKILPKDMANIVPIVRN